MEQQTTNEYSEILKVINVVNGLAQFDRKELEAYPEFNKILSRVHPSKGDADGRKKYLNNKELLYIKFMSNFAGQHRGFHGDAKHEKAKMDAQLPDEWKPDDHVQAAIAKAIEIQIYYTPTVRLLNAIEKGMMLSAEAAESQLDQVYTAIKTGKRLTDELKDTKDLSEAQKTIDAMLNVSDLLQARVNGFMKSAGEVPKVLKQLKELQSQVIQEQNGERSLRGGHKKGNREDPR